MGFTREERERLRDTTVPDLVGDEPPRLVFVGINPGRWTAATQTHFAHPGNRFYPALHRAGITPHEHNGSGMPMREALSTGPSPPVPRCFSTVFAGISTDSHPATRNPRSR